MQSFQENRCRLCPKTFCCEKCRVRHEEEFHNVNPECEICIYGRTTINKASVTLLSHIKSAHWPLHCVFCQKVFSSLDELVPHDKCPLKLEALKMQGTPKTPVTPITDKEEPSPEITPFYKIAKGGTHQLGPSSISMAVTSTPLFHKEETHKHERITPINESQISTHKSNLKSTGSSNLSDSKRSNRRVTFSETPSFADCCKKPKCFSLPKQIKDEPEEETEDSTDDSYASVEEEIFKTAPTTANLEEKENINNEIIIFDKSNTDGTLWESALAKGDFTTSNANESLNASKINVSLQINVFNNNVKIDDGGSSLNVKGSEDASLLNKSTNLWSSMTNIVKSVVSNISMTAQNSFTSVSTKRCLPDNDALDNPSLKRMKLTELKCRRTIRDISPTYLIRLARSRYVDKATQTEDTIGYERL